MPKSIDITSGNCGRTGHLSQSQWRDLVRKKMSVTSWLAMTHHCSRGLDIVCLPDMCDALRHFLSRDDLDNVAREDVCLSDVELSGIGTGEGNCLVSAQSGSGVREDVLDICQALADSQFALREWSSGTFDECGADYVAIYRGGVIGFGNDSKALRCRVAASRGIAKQQVVVQYVGHGG